MAGSGSVPVASPLRPSLSQAGERAGPEAAFKTAHPTPDGVASARAHPRASPRGQGSAFEPKCFLLPRLKASLDWSRQLRQHPEVLQGVSQGAVRGAHGSVCKALHVAHKRPEVSNRNPAGPKRSAPPCLSELLAAAEESLQYLSIVQKDRGEAESWRFPRGPSSPTRCRTRHPPATAVQGFPHPQGKGAFPFHLRVTKPGKPTVGTAASCPKSSSLPHSLRSRRSPRHLKVGKHWGNSQDSGAEP